MCFTKGENPGHFDDGRGRWYLNRVLCTCRLAQIRRAGPAGPGLPGGIEP